MTPTEIGILFGFQAFMLLAQILLNLHRPGPSVIYIPVPFAVIPAAKDESICFDDKTDPGSNPQEQLQ